ncbi:gliding motility-associated C-terminal domain-containing protein [Hymenobacter lucidus]|uniref:Gliding motility-associated C-terminal domain-containing protein n=1 Tax=Hymenobacter lucidus TaxID=2880930 RepID=A0ABS8APF8_9BACT|nr:gliding motility-associated C-terminal domain-containing protein [Hymenobacter lucidus]MCB2407206.1 gliding motility-associated C-terminal domain-containing protein [Hymenobacter lucidus]
MKYLPPTRFMGLVWLLGLLPYSSAAQTWQWAVAPGNTPISASEVTAMVPDKDGTTVVAGYFSGTITLGRFTLTSSGPADVFVARLDNSGNWLQAVRAGSGNACLVSALLIEADGTVVVGGSFSGRAIDFGSFRLINADNFGNSEDVFVARLNQAGTWVQAVRAGGNSIDGVMNMALDNQGNVVVGGKFASAVASFGPFQLPNAYVGTGGFASDDVFVARLNRSGAWVQAVRAGGPSHDYPTDLVMEPDGTFVVAGNFFSAVSSFGAIDLQNTGQETDVFVARLSPAGTWIAALRAGGPNYDSVSDIALAADGSLVVAGSFNGPSTAIGSFTLLNTDNTGTYPDAYVARLDRAGTWTQAVRAGSPDSDAAIRIVPNADGSVTVAGYFTGRASFGSFTPSSAGGNDIYVAQLSAAGQWTRFQQAGGPGNDGVRGFYQKDSNNFTIAGYIGWPTAQFGTITLANKHTLFSNAFVAHYSSSAVDPVDPPDSVFTTAAFTIPNIITPNGDKKNDVFRFSNAPVTDLALYIFNRWGQQVYTSTHYQQDWDAAGLPTGMYYYYVVPAGGALVKGWLEVVR